MINREIGRSASPQKDIYAVFFAPPDAQRAQKKKGNGWEKEVGVVHTSAIDEMQCHLVSPIQL